MGGTKLRAAVVDAKGGSHKALSERVFLDRDAFVRRVREIVSHLDPSGKMPVGIGLPGRVDTSTNMPVTAGYLDIAGLPLAHLVGPERRVFLDNDAAMALRAEMMVGAARGLGNVVMITIGTGVGGACALDHRMLRGNAFAGQFGHISVAALTGPRCKCGRLGCLETVGSGTALGRLVEEEGTRPGIQALELLREARGEVGPAYRVVHRWAAALRSGIDSLSATFDPDMIIIGGGLGSEASAALEFVPPGSVWFARPVLAADLGDRAGVVGAGLYALSAGSDYVGAGFSS
ncbi:ROK family protein [Lichenicoccus sp.]|uniref:ROK family protein n=1 Tax=Lichenicoccus sp. TaxID=2781899 RepID=UPI003D0DE458